MIYCARGDILFSLFSSTNLRYKQISFEDKWKNLLFSYVTVVPGNTVLVDSYFKNFIETFI